MQMEKLYDVRELLPIKMYELKYNNNRKSRAVALMCCLNKYKPYYKLPKSKKEDILLRIEKSCYETACGKANGRGVMKDWDNELFVQIYNSILFKVQSNIWNEEADDYFVKRITDGSIDIDKIGAMSSYYMRPHMSQDIRNEIEIRKNQSIKKKISAQYECHKCGGRKTSVIEVQARCLDEGATLQITCEMEFCNNKWIINT
jgi:DNA-directed RNA polymerase subunit M/transcription elongation factor TFIIS